MQVGVMVTNGGPHSPEKWAATTAQQIMDSVFSAEAQMTIAAKQFEIELLKALLPQHDKVQKTERDHLKRRGADRLFSPIDVRDHAFEVADLIAQAAARVGRMDVPDPDSPGQTKAVDLGAHFSRQDVREKLAGLIGAHFATATDIERSWHADRASDDEDVRAYKLARETHGAAHVHAHASRYLRRNPSSQS